MPMDLYGLVKLIKAHEVTRFDPTNQGGHGSTRYREWFKQNTHDGNSIIEIDCFLSNRYEPYLVFRYCQELPPFQEPFSGYGKNKMTWVMQLRRLGYTFWQLGKGAFIIHYPHLDSPSRVAWNDAPRKLKGHSAKQWLAYKRGRMDELFVEFREWLRKEIPDETKTPFCKDKLDDDATLRYDRDTFHNHTAQLVLDMEEHERQ
jgi:Glycosyl-transferase for dystroglycan